MFDFIRKLFRKEEEPQTVRLTEKTEKILKKQYKKNRKGSKAWEKQTLQALKSRHQKNRLIIIQNHDEICPACNPNSPLSLYEWLRLSKIARAKNAKQGKERKRLQDTEKVFPTHDRPIQERWSPTPETYQSLAYVEYQTQICLCGEPLSSHENSDSKNHFDVGGCVKSSCAKFTVPRK